MAKTLTLVEAIKKYPLGFTYDVTKTKTIIKKSGYFVSITDYKLPIDEPLAQVVFRILKTHNALQAMMPNVKLYIGGWCSNSLPKESEPFEKQGFSQGTNRHGTKFLDFSIYTKNQQQAEILKEVFKQKTYYIC